MTRGHEAVTTPAAPAKQRKPRAQPLLRVQYHVPDDQAHLVPQDVAVHFLPGGEAPIPRVGDVVCLGAQSLWGVHLVVWHPQAPQQWLVEVWLQHVHGDGQAGAEHKVMH